MLGRVVVEGEQGFLVGGDLFDRLGPLRPELARERLDGLFGLSLLFSAPVISRMAAFARGCTLFGIESRTFVVLWTQSL